MKSSPASFIRLDGLNFVRDGQPVRLRGFNLGNWMMIESYMIGLPWTEYEMRRQWRWRLGNDSFRAFFDTFMECSMTDADAAYLKAQGFNLLQVPFNYRHFVDPATDRTAAGFDNDGERHLDRLVVLARRHDFHLILGLHAAPLSQARDWNAESACGEALFWEHPEAPAKAAEIWRRIAARYVDEPVILGYELLSEPVSPDRALFNRYNRLLAAAVREVDPHHILFFSGNRWNKELDSLDADLFEDPQTAPSLHCYACIQEPFNRLREYPQKIDGQWIDRDYVSRYFWSALHARPLERATLIGEFGIVRRRIAETVEEEFQPSVHEAINADLIEFFEEAGCPWTAWAWKDLGVLGLAAPKNDTPWQQFLDRQEVRQLRRGFNLEIGPQLRKTADLLWPFLPEDDRHVFVLQCRHHYDATVLPSVLDKLRDYSPNDLQEMARSFAFENCTVDPRLLRIYTGGKAV